MPRNRLCGFLIFCSLLVPCCFAGQELRQAGTQEVTLRAFLRGYLSSISGVDDVTTRYSFAAASLSGNMPQEIVVYVTGRGWCGSGGCRTLILKPKGSSYEVVSDVTITWPPIRVLPSKTNGWHDIAVWVEGGGIQPGYFAVLSFNGREYPTNPSIVPFHRPLNDTEGTVIIPENQQGALLYQ
jgi:hypothetical protein